jgi:hypothetical protein
MAISAKDFEPSKPSLLYNVDEFFKAAVMLRYLFRGIGVSVGSSHLFPGRKRMPS